MPFAALGLPATILKGVRAAGYTEPTPIQRQAIPLVLQGRDVIGAAQTGTGKTAAFVLPILTRLLEGRPQLRALVLTPTRELAAQVETNARDYARFTPLRVGVVYGGVPLPPQERMLRPGVDLLVATPGRLLDLHGRLALDEGYLGNPETARIFGRLQESQQEKLLRRARKESEPISHAEVAKLLERFEK